MKVLQNKRQCLPDTKMIQTTQPQMKTKMIVIICIVIGVIVIISFWIFHLKQTVNTTQIFNNQAPTAIPSSEMQAVQKYNQAIIKQDWNTVYELTSRIAVGDNTKEQYAQLMSQQIQNAGAISSILVTSTTQITKSPDGVPYFTVHENVVSAKNGILKTQTFISIFILEENSWKYWFSKKI